MALNDPGQYDMLREIADLSRENNEMLHTMRRHAFLGGFFKLVVYLVMLFIPFWIYETYFSSTMNSMIGLANQAQVKTQQINGQTQQVVPVAIVDMIKQLQSAAQTVQNIQQFIASSTATSTGSTTATSKK